LFPSAGLAPGGIVPIAAHFACAANFVLQMFLAPPSAASMPTLEWGRYGRARIDGGLRGR
jgi:hypothetical protein